MSQATSSGFFPCRFISPASLLPLVVLPAPCRPTSMTTVGPLGLMLICLVSLPMSLQSSSLTIFTIIWAGVRDSRTSAPMQRSVTDLVKSLTTL